MAVVESSFRAVASRQSGANWVSGIASHVVFRFNVSLGAWGRDQTRHDVGLSPGSLELS